VSERTLKKKGHWRIWSLF